MADYFLWVMLLITAMIASAALAIAITALRREPVAPDPVEHFPSSPPPVPGREDWRSNIL